MAAAPRVVLNGFGKTCGLPQLAELGTSTRWSVNARPRRSSARTNRAPRCTWSGAHRVDCPPWERRLLRAETVVGRADLAARRQLLDSPAVSVWIAEEHKASPAEILYVTD